MKKLIFGALAGVALASCSHTQTVYKDRPVTVNVPVPQPCVNGIRPTPPIPLKKRFTDDQWKALDAKQKSAVEGKQALDLKTYGEDLNAATAACP